MSELIGRSSLPFVVVLPLVGGLAFVVAVIIAAVGGGLGEYHAVGRLLWSTIVKPPPNVLGWVLIYLGLGWIAIVVFQHLYPLQPSVTLSPAGVSYHRSWLKNLLIPWQDIRGVGRVETLLADGTVVTSPQAIAVVVDKAFYEQNIAPLRRRFAPPGSDVMFQPKGELMQVVLTCADVAVDPLDYLRPIEARWKTFRERPRSAPEPCDQSIGSSPPPIVHRRWETARCCRLPVFLRRSPPRSPLFCTRAPCDEVHADSRRQGRPATVQ